MTGPVRVGTRGSGLALWQTETVVAALRQLDPSADFSIVTVRSAGDEDPEAPLSSLGVGVFTAAIGRALAEGKVDLAVHSLKDLPVQAAPGMIVVPVMEREDPRDVLVDRWSKTLLDLPAGARIGSSSPRRTAQLSYGRNDVVFTPMRGNVETRVRKAGGPDYDGAVLAAAGGEAAGTRALRERVPLTPCLRPRSGTGRAGSRGPHGRCGRSWRSCADWCTHRRRPPSRPSGRSSGPLGAAAQVPHRRASGGGGRRGAVVRDSDPS